MDIEIIQRSGLLPTASQNQLAWMVYEKEDMEAFSFMQHLLDFRPNNYGVFSNGFLLALAISVLSKNEITFKDVVKFDITQRYRLCMQFITNYGYLYPTLSKNDLTSCNVAPIRNFILLLKSISSDIIYEPLKEIDHINKLTSKSYVSDPDLNEKNKQLGDNIEPSLERFDFRRHSGTYTKSKYESLTEVSTQTTNNPRQKANWLHADTKTVQSLMRVDEPFNSFSKQLINAETQTSTNHHPNAFERSFYYESLRSKTMSPTDSLEVPAETRPPRNVRPPKPVQEGHSNVQIFHDIISGKREFRNDGTVMLTKFGEESKAGKHSHIMVNIDILTAKGSGYLREFTPEDEGKFVVISSDQLRGPRLLPPNKAAALRLSRFHSNEFHTAALTDIHVAKSDMVNRFLRESGLRNSMTSYNSEPSFFSSHVESVAEFGEVIIPEIVVDSDSVDTEKAKESLISDYFQVDSDSVDTEKANEYLHDLDEYLDDNLRQSQSSVPSETDAESILHEEYTDAGNTAVDNEGLCSAYFLPMDDLTQDADFEHVGIPLINGEEEEFSLPVVYEHNKKSSPHLKVESVKALKPPKFTPRQRSNLRTMSKKPDTDVNKKITPYDWRRAKQAESHVARSPGKPPKTNRTKPPHKLNDHNQYQEALHNLFQSDDHVPPRVPTPGTHRQREAVVRPKPNAPSSGSKLNNRSREGRQPSKIQIIHNNITTSPNPSVFI